MPSYLGYGILDRKSVRFENDVITASYVLDPDGSVVHKVTWERARCILETFLHGAFAGYSTYPDLNKALSYDFLNRDLSKDKVYGFLALKASTMGNIYVELPDTAKGEEPNIAFYPAGFLLSFRLPVPGTDDMLNRFLETISANPEISLHRTLDARLVRRNMDGTNTERNVPVAEFIVAVAYLTRAAGIFARSGVIWPEKEYRLMVTEAYHAEKAFAQTFIGNDKYPWFTYIYPKDQRIIKPIILSTSPSHHITTPPPEKS